ncbi:MAG: hypothetical protein Q4B54_09390 [Coriobacteriales bacterium]|nr:hypothetical protein [Coriobacteriales bacterium]
MRARATAPAIALAAALACPLACALSLGACASPAPTATQQSSTSNTSNTSTKASASSVSSTSESGKDATAPLLTSASGAKDEPAPLNFTGNSFSWDGEDNGTVETYFVDYYDNGDEAPNTIEFIRSGEQSTGAFLDAAYSIESLEAKRDDQGPYLLISYTTGDYYNHDTAAQATLRIADGTMVIQPL